MIFWLYFVRSGRGLNWIKVILNVSQLLLSDFLHCVGLQSFNKDIIPVIVNDPKFIKWDLITLEIKITLILENL